MGFRSWRGRRTAVHSSSFPDKYEVGRILNYAAKLTRTVRDRSRSARAIRQWLMEDGREVGLEPLDNAAGVPHHGAHSGRPDDAHLESMSELAQRLEDHATAVTAGCSPLQISLNFVSELFDLDPFDAEIVGLLVRYRLHAGFQNLIDHVLDAREFKPEVLISALTGHPAVAVSDWLNPRMPLLDSGMVGRPNSAAYGLSRYYEVPNRLIDSLSMPAATSADVRRALIGPELASELNWAHFDHVEAERDLVTGVIRGARKARASAVNILIRGRPGTGKTSLVAAVARHLDLTLYRAGESVDSTVPDRADRLPMLRWAQRVASPWLLKYEPPLEPHPCRP